jgi:spore coat protein U-like protein
MTPSSHSLTSLFSIDRRARMFRSRVFGAILMLSIPAQPVYALLENCTVSTSGVSFGAYDVFSPAANDATGDVSVACTGIGLASYTILLSTGSGSYASRLMSSGSHLLVYNLYVDPNRTIVWGDGSAGTQVINDSYLLLPVIQALGPPQIRTTETRHYPVYGRIPARQNAYVGNYSDTLIVTVNY